MRVLLVVDKASRGVGIRRQIEACDRAVITAEAPVERPLGLDAEAPLSDVAVVQVDRAVGGGLDRIRELGAARVPVVAALSSIALAPQASDAGAKGFVVLDTDHAWQPVLEAVASGALAVSHKHVAAVYFQGAAIESSAPSLTAREVEVLELVAEGCTAAEIARHLEIAPRTVRHHIAEIKARLGAPDRASAVAAAMRLGLIKSARSDGRLGWDA